MRLGVTNQGYGRVYGPPVASDRETDDSGDGEEETGTEEVDVRCSILSLCASVSADSLLLYYSNPVVSLLRIFPILPTAVRSA